MTQKTVVIWDKVEETIKFFVIDKNLDHLNNKYINSWACSGKEEEEVMNVAFDSKLKQIPMSDVFPVEEVKAGAKVVVMGLLSPQ